MRMKLDDWSLWDDFVGRIVVRADRMVRYIGELPGRASPAADIARPGCLAALSSAPGGLDRL